MSLAMLLLPIRLDGLRDAIEIESGGRFREISISPVNCCS